MSAAHAPIRASILLVAGAVVACAASPPRPVIGMSDAVPDQKSAPPKAAPPPAAWPDFAAARAWPEAAPAFVALGHHRDGSLLHVRVEPAALAAYRDLSVESPMPEGARVVAWHETPSGVLLGGYLMAKRGDNWTAEELDAHGAIVPGDRAPCLRCHAMSPSDHLFGVRRGGAAPHINGESIEPQRR